jgi:hypothetical protein
VELTHEEKELSERDPFLIKNEEEKILKSLMSKLDVVGENILNVKIMDAVMFDRGMLFPHYEKAGRWAKVAKFADKLGEPSARLWSLSAHNYKLNNDYINSAKNYENAVHKAVNENIENKIIRSLYRESKINYKNSGDDSGAHRMYVAELDYIRQNSNITSKLFLTIYRLTSLYGESPSRVALSAFFIIFMCSIIYWINGINTNSGVIYSFSSSFYFSVVTFTTLGYGDFSPLPGISRFIAATEAISGLLLTSLFLVTFVRKYSR